MAPTNNPSEPAQPRCKPRTETRVQAWEEGLTNHPSLTSMSLSPATLANASSIPELSARSLQWLYGMAMQSLLHWTALESAEHSATQTPELPRSREMARMQVAEIAEVIERFGFEPRIPAAALRSWRLVPSRLTELEAIAQLHEVQGMIAEILRRIPDPVN